MTTIRATRQSVRALRKVPASLKLTGFALLSAHRGTLVMHLPGGRPTLEFRGDLPGVSAEMTVHDLAFSRRAIMGGDIGFAEGYMDGMWSTEDLTAVLEYFGENFDNARKLAIGNRIVRIANGVRHLMNRNTRGGARRNIVAHYDLGNDFYSAWLDPSMTYSSGIYASENTSLEQSQHAKYLAVCDRIHAGPDKHILEIGCGWGGFAEVAARERGARVTCVTISDAQHAFATERMARAGLSDLVDIRLCDYRDIQGKFDAVASIEMFEAVGEEYWPSYFSKISEVLKPGGHAALQVITIRDDLFYRYRKRADFIQRYVFPGGMLPSEQALEAQFSAAGLRYDAKEMFGESYGRTLREWKRRFENAWPNIQSAAGFDDTFKRLWQFYLSYCEAGFRSGRINVGQFVVSKT